MRLEEKDLIYWHIPIAKEANTILGCIREACYWYSIGFGWKLQDILSERRKTLYEIRHKLEDRYCHIPRGD